MVELPTSWDAVTTVGRLQESPQVEPDNDFLCPLG
jgi:hypothetical protein